MRTVYVLLSELTTGDVVRFGGDDITVSRVACRDGQVVVMGENRNRGGMLAPCPVPDRPVQVWR